MFFVFLSLPSFSKETKFEKRLQKDSCFTKWEAKNNYIVNYLEEIF